MTHKIIYSKTKHGRVRLLPDMTLKLTIPFSKKGDKNFENILLKKGNVLIKKYQNSGENKIKTIGENYVLIFGEKVKLSQIDTSNIDLYLKKLLYEKSIILVEKYSNLLGISFRKLHIKNTKTIWGSCSSIQNITLNQKLVHLPSKYLEYVIIHEVCHLKEKNHSLKFWKLVEGFLPNYKIIRKELKSFKI